MIFRTTNTLTIPIHGDRGNDLNVSKSRETLPAVTLVVYAIFGLARFPTLFGRFRTLSFDRLQNSVSAGCYTSAPPIAELFVYQHAMKPNTESSRTKNGYSICKNFYMSIMSLANITFWITFFRKI